MKTVLKVSMYAFMIMALGFTSCSPEDGEDGMDGAPGIQGPMGLDGQDGMDGADGMDGQDGADGQNGQDGNANVFSSGWEEFVEANWEPVSNEFGIDFRNYPLTVAEVTQDIVDEGVVLMYSRFVITGTQVYALPFTENITGADAAGQTISYRFEVNDITIKMRNVSGTGDPGIFGGPGIAEYRYIIIPSSNKSNQGSSSQNILDDLRRNGVDINNYDSVASYFNL